MMGTRTHCRRMRKKEARKLGELGLVEILRKFSRKSSSGTVQGQGSNSCIKPLSRQSTQQSITEILNICTLIYYTVRKMAWMKEYKSVRGRKISEKNSIINIPRIAWQNFDTHENCQVNIFSKNLWTMKCQESKQGNSG